MPESNFIDYVKICCRSGKGGAGSVHFYRSKFNPKGGPDGGNGGRGGHVIARGNKQRWTLLHLKYRKHVIAQPGKPGGDNNKTGADGEDAIIEVPLGTVIRDVMTNEVIGEITEDGQEIIVVPGGRGGLGNAHFKNALNQAPRYAQPGEPGREEWKIFELKLLADVGMVGFPNAGKSTLLSVLTAAKPEIADYPFTTLVPQLGLVKVDETHSFVLADIPGIIEGAHRGRGLGIRFLRHIERNAVLLFVVSCESADIKKEYNILLDELKKYNPQLLDKDRVLAITKTDLLDQELEKEIAGELPDLPYVFVSAHQKKGLSRLVDVLWNTLTCHDRMGR